MLITWDELYSVKVEEIDEQHKKIVNYINELHAAMKKGQGKDIIGEIIENLVDYSIVHFSTEEKYFDLYNYDEAAPHKLEHKRFIETVGKFQKDYQEGDSLLPIEVMDFLEDWLVTHMLDTDKKYSNCFNSNGLF